MKKHPLTRRNLLKASAMVGAGTLSPVSWSANTNDVIVIGAGLSGLYAASMLERAGLSVKVLEGNTRIGGRLYTLDDVKGLPEAGGQTIGPTYGRMIFLAGQVGAKLGKVSYSLGSEKHRQILNVAGNRLLPHEWVSADDNPFPEEFKAVPPDRLLMQLMGKPPFEMPNGWTNEELFHLDIPVAEFLKAKGFDEASIHTMGISNNYGRNLRESSLLFLHKTHHLVYASMNTPGGMRTVIGGNQRVPELLAASLKGQVLLNQKVEAVVQKNERVSVRCIDGSEHQASYVISSVPLTMLRKMKIDTDIPDLQKRAINELAYSSVLQAHFEVKEPFWQGKGFLPNVWTDSLIERVFASDPEYTGNITNLTVWINGEATEPLERMPAAEARKQIEKDFYRILPEATGKVRFARLHSWGQEPFAQGAFSVWSPGQIRSFSKVIAQPAGRLHFAGEHTAQWASGMEAALESGERAALEIIEKIQS